MSPRVFLASALAGLAFAASSAAAADRPPRYTPAPGVALKSTSHERPATWGTANTSLLRLGANAFLPDDQDGTVQWAYYGAARWQAAGNSDFVAPVQLPSGALILGVELNATDTNATYDMSALFIVGNAHSWGGLNYGGPYTTGSSGDQTVYHDLSGYNMTVDNVNNHYYISVSFDTVNGNSLLLDSVGVYYRLQVSPAPVVATFGDVPTNHPFFQFIEALAAAGITGGCGGGNFCPNNPVTRGQMAVFLAKALGLNFE